MISDFIRDLEYSETTYNEQYVEGMMTHEEIHHIEEEIKIIEGDLSEIQDDIEQDAQEHAKYFLSNAFTAKTRVFSPSQDFK